jgi:hypothetical protein
VTSKFRFRDFRIVRRHTIYAPRARERARTRARAPKTMHHARTEGILAPFPSRELGGCGDGYWERARAKFRCFRFLGPLLGIFTPERQK